MDAKDLKQIQKFFPGPYKYDGLDGVRSSNGDLVLDIRGWGRLTGIGNKNRVSLGKAMSIQKNMGEWIADALNKYMNEAC